MSGRADWGKWFLDVLGLGMKSEVKKSSECGDGEDGKVCTRMYGRDLGQRY